MDPKIKALMAERLTVWSRMKEILDKAEKREDGSTGGLTGEALTEYTAAESRLDDLSKEIEARKRAADIAAELNRPLDEVASRQAETATATGADPKAAYESTFRSFLHATKDDPISAEQRSVLRQGQAEMRDLGVATGGAGGFMVPQGFLVKITQAMKYFGPMRDLANKIETTSGNPLPWPGNDDTGNVGAILAENTALSTLDVTLTTRTLNAYVYTSLLVKVSWQLQNDAAFDIEAFLGDRFAERLGRIQNTHFTTGSGSGQPQGFVTGAASGKTITRATGNTTSALAYNDLINLQHKVDPAYRSGPNVAWQMNDLTLATVRQMVDTTGRPLWVPAGSFGSLDEGQQDILLGKPIYINNDMAVAAANAVVAAFGDWKRSYIVRDVVGIGLVKLEERYADQLQTGFFSWMRTDAQVDDANAFAVIKQSAT